MGEQETCTDARLLVVDDTPSNVAVLSAMLAEGGYDNIRAITDPRQVEGTVADWSPDLVLLDIRMPHMDGHQVFDRLKARWADRCPPVIVLTAQNDRETRTRALGQGVRDFLTKPFDHEEVLQRIGNALEDYGAYRRQVDHSEELEQMVRARTAELERLALEDPVTALPNRKAMLEEIDQRLERGESVAVCFLVLDGVDEVAQLHGYPVAEALFRRLAERLVESAPDWRVGAWGGSELLLVTRPYQPDHALQVAAEAFLARLQPVEEMNGLRLALEGRLGLTRAPQDGSRGEDLVRRAALALPQPGSGSRIRLFSSEQESALADLRAMQHQLKVATARDELHLVYQPQIDLRDGRVIGAEALLRWNHPQRGQVSPGEFVPVAEASGQMGVLGQWVVDEACRQLAAWRASGQIDETFKLAVNVSPAQLSDPGFADWLLAALAHWQVPARALTLEVTESALMEDVGLARHLLTQISDAGLEIAVDDFGTGYSSLAYLKTLPVDTLKIDRAFVRDLARDHQDQVLSQAVVAMAHSFRHEVVAEGIEMPEQAALLRDLGCEYAQGFWFAPPLSAAGFVSLYQDPPDWSF